MKHLREIIPLVEEESEISHYDIVNHRTGQRVGRATTKHGARRAVDRHDNKYGGYAHRMVPVYKKESLKENLSVAVPDAHPFRMQEKEGTKFFKTKGMKNKVQQNVFKFLRTHPKLGPITQLAVKHHLKSNPDRRPYKG